MNFVEDEHFDTVIQNDHLYTGEQLPEALSLHFTKQSSSASIMIRLERDARH